MVISASGNSNSGPCHFVQHAHVSSKLAESIIWVSCSPTSRAGRRFLRADFALERLLGGITPAAFPWRNTGRKSRAGATGVAGLRRLAQSRQLCPNWRNVTTPRAACPLRARQCLLDHGPSRRMTLANLPEENWSLLVSGGISSCRKAMRCCMPSISFRSLRLDDLMVSLRPPAAGVGPHSIPTMCSLIQAGAAPLGNQRPGRFWK